MLKTTATIRESTLISRQPKHFAGCVDHLYRINDIAKFNAIGANILYWRSAYGTGN